MLRAATDEEREQIDDVRQAILDEAQRLADADVEINQRMARNGAALVKEGDTILHHCNTGSLATGGYGTALGVIRSAGSAGKLNAVFADETRPWLQGARLTAWELVRDDIPVTLLVDGAAAHLMKQGKVQWVIVGSMLHLFMRVSLCRLQVPIHIPSFCWMIMRWFGRGSSWA